jgi:hypothetical protein
MMASAVSTTGTIAFYLIREWAAVNAAWFNPRSNYGKFYVPFCL